MTHRNHEVREVKGPFGELIYLAYCGCGHYRKHSRRLSAELDLADHLMTVMEEAVAVEPADNFIDNRKDGPSCGYNSVDTFHEWYRDHELRRNYE